MSFGHLTIGNGKIISSELNGTDLYRVDKDI